MVKFRSKWGPSRVLQGPLRAVGQNRAHFLARAKGSGSGGLNGVKIGFLKMAFSLTPFDRQKTKIEVSGPPFLDKMRPKVVKMTKIWGPRHGFVRLWAGPPAQRQLVRGPSRSLPQDPQRVQNGQNWVKFLFVPEVPPRSLQGKGNK